MVNAKYLLAAVAGIASAAPSIEERTHGKHVVHKVNTIAIATAQPNPYQKTASLLTR